MHETTTDFSLDLDATGRVTRGSGRFHAMLGLTDAQIRGRPIDSLLSPHDAVLALEILYCVAEEHRPIDVSLSFVGANGEEFTARVNATSMESNGRHLLTHLECLRDESLHHSNLMDAWGAPDNLGNVLDQFETCLMEDTFENPALTVFTLAPDEAEDPEEIAEAAIRMARTVELHAGEDAVALRTGERSVSVLHDDDFNGELVRERIQTGLGDVVSVESFTLDLDEGEGSVQERVAVIDTVLSANSATGFVPEDVSSMSAVLNHLERNLDTHFATESFSASPAISATDGTATVQFVHFDSELPTSRAASPAERELRTRAVKVRLSRVSQLAETTKSRVVLELGYEEIVALAPTELEQVSQLMIVSLTSLPGPDSDETETLTERLNLLPGIVLDGLMIGRNEIGHKTVSRLRSVRFISIHCAAFGPAPSITLGLLQTTAKSLAGREVGIIVTGVDEPAHRENFNGLAGLHLYGKAVGPGG